MKNAKLKIISTAAALMCAAAVIGAGSFISRRSDSDVLPVSTVGISTERPVIILDAGHGGIDGGCSSADGVPEKGINLNILLKLRDMLEISGCEVRVTRDSDVSIHNKGVQGIANQKSSDMDNRLAIFNGCDAICISIHQNQFTDPKYSGAQMFYSENNGKSELLARSLKNSFNRLQPDNRREIKLCGKELFLCYYSKNPTVMVECGFLSNPDEAALLNTDEYQGKVAFSILSGISSFLSDKANA